MLPEHWKNVASMHRRREFKEALITSPWALPFAIAIIGLRPLKFIRICGIRNDRIGHFVPDGAEQVIRFKRRGPKECRIYYFAVPVSCNQQWEVMLRRALPVKSRALRHVVRWLRRLPGGGTHIIPSTYTASQDIEGLFADGDAALPFTPDEEATAIKWLESRGWTKEQPFICLLVRDAAFTASDPVANFGFKADPSAWEYHSYRNSDIETYVSAIEWLNENGVWVLRMGRNMERRTPHSDERFIDYAFDDEQSDLLDIWLFANSCAVISTGTGPDLLAALYQKPCLLLNFLPVSYLFGWTASSCFPKWLTWRSSGSLLTLTEYLENTLFTTEEYQACGIAITNLTPDEIKGATQRFFHAFLEMSVTSSDAEQEFFWNTLLRSSGIQKYIHPAASVDAGWLRKVLDAGSF